tara:strand:+ start:1197 stop:1778 length:582 start_codon:yes stop_codon:yes gene_type:complete
MTEPLSLLKAWLDEEQAKGAPNPRQAVLSTCGNDAIPHARVVAIREIEESGLLFFTQKGTKKVKEMLSNPHACITFWFELFQREVILQGLIEPLSQDENKKYWESYSKEAKIRFYSYAETSSQPILHKDVLEDKKRQVEDEYRNKALPLSPYYCGFRVKPSTIMFYAYRTDELSDVFEYQRVADAWQKQWLSP